MPCLNLQFTTLGPVIDVLVYVSTPRKEIMDAAGLPIPNPVPCHLLIDTGASNTCIDPEKIKLLKLTPSGNTPVHTPSTTPDKMHNCNQYDVGIIIPDFWHFHAVPILESSLSHQGIDGLLGRDILKECILIYNGILGSYTLSI